MKGICMCKCRIAFDDIPMDVTLDEMVSFVKDAISASNFWIHSVRYNYNTSGKLLCCDIYYLLDCFYGTGEDFIWDNYMKTHASGKMQKAISDCEFDDFLEWSEVKYIDLDNV